MFASKTSFAFGPNKVVWAVEDDFVELVARVEFPLEFECFFSVDGRLAEERQVVGAAARRVRETGAVLTGVLVRKHQFPVLNRHQHYVALHHRFPQSYRKPTLLILPLGSGKVPELLVFKRK